MSPIERLKVIASGSINFPLDAIPEKLIHVDASIISEIGYGIREVLLKKIGRRRGRWREIANYIRKQG
jgi:hypothetical protein